MTIQMLATYVLFWFAIGMFVAHLLVRIKTERVIRSSSARKEEEFWLLLRVRTFIGTMAALIAAMLAMAT